MASFTKINDFVKDLAHGSHDLSSDQLTVALSNTAPSAESSDPTADGNGILANVTEISYTNLSSRNITTSASSQTSGTYKLVLTDLTLTASGGAVATFRYVYVYNSTPAANPLIAVFDKGATVDLADGDSIDIDFSASNGLLQIA